MIGTGKTFFNTTKEHANDKNLIEYFEKEYWEKLETRFIPETPDGFPWLYLMGCLIDIEPEKIGDPPGAFVALSSVDYSGRTKELLEPFLAGKKIFQGNGWFIPGTIEIEGVLVRIIAVREFDGSIGLWIHFPVNPVIYLHWVGFTQSRRLTHDLNKHTKTGLHYDYMITLSHDGDDGRIEYSLHAENSTSFIAPSMSYRQADLFNDGIKVGIAVKEHVSDR